MADAERFHMGLTLGLWAILLAGSMYLMLVTAAHKTIYITDTGYGQGNVEESVDYAAAVRVGKLILRETPADQNIFYIPLAKGGKPENVVVENSYAKGELRVYIKDADQDFYENQAVSGSISSILSATWETQKSGVMIRLRMNGIYEYQNSLEGENLKIAVYSPHELYKLVAVVDPSGGGSENGRVAGGKTEKEIALSVARLIQAQMKNSDIRLYFTRLEDADVSQEERCALVQAVKADLFINIGVATDDDSQKYGIRGWYNEAYFIPEFGNVQLADSLTKQVTIASKNRAVGLESAEPESILAQLSLPAARVEIGYLTNESERELLSQDDYRQKLAEGIAKSIEEVYETYYE